MTLRSSRRLPARRAAAAASSAIRTRRVWLDDGGAHRAGGGRCARHRGGPDRQERRSSAARATTRRCWSITSGDRRVDEKKVAALVGATRPCRCRVRARRAPASRSAASSPLAHATAAGHADRPRAVPLRGDLGRRRPPQRRVQADARRTSERSPARRWPTWCGVTTLAPLHAGVRRSPSALHLSVCRMDAASGCAKAACARIDEIAAWGTMDDARQARRVAARSSSAANARPHSADEQETHA